MLRPKGRVSRERRFDVFFVTILAIVAAILWIAQPVMATARTIHVVAHKQGGGTDNISITYNQPQMAQGQDNTVSGTKNGVPFNGSSEPVLPFHVNTYIQALDKHGPFLVIGDNTCVCYPYGGRLRCIGTPCP